MATTVGCLSNIKQIFALQYSKKRTEYKTLIDSLYDSGKSCTSHKSPS